MRQKKAIDSFQEVEQLAKALLAISEQYPHFCLYRSNWYADSYGRYELLAAVGSLELRSNLNEWSQALERTSDWWFGGIAYETKDQFEKLSSKQTDQMEVANTSFFRPQWIISWERDAGQASLHFPAEQTTEAKAFLTQLEGVAFESQEQSFQLKARMSKTEYLKRFAAIKHHIQMGDIYEMNFCQEFYDEEAKVEPAQLYDQLNRTSPMPFSAYMKQGDKYLICASPERYLCKQGNKLVTQPIKGTIRRSEFREEDELLQQRLANDPKEQNENVMIVDVARNDLSRLASKGSVLVEELFGVYRFPQVHQLISTISAELNDETSFADILAATFPMASMTGAPKIRAMEIIEQYETARRSWYSGAVGYISPEHDFDFNVVIRSLQYHRSQQYLSLTVGGAVTDMAEGEKEFEECLLKAKAIFDLFKTSVVADA